MMMIKIKAKTKKWSPGEADGKANGRGGKDGGGPLWPAHATWRVDREVKGGEFSYIAHNKTSAILTVIIIGIVQQSGFKLCKDHGHSKSDAHKPLDPWNVDGYHYVNDGDP